MTRRLPARRALAGTALVAAALSLAAQGPAAAEPADYVIDPTHFSIVFNAEHIGYERIWGLFVAGEGSFTYDEEARTLSDLTVTVDAASVVSGNDARDGHLRSAEFLDAEASPDITFVMTGAEPQSDTTGTITGDLTLRGETHPVTLDVTLNKIGAYPFGNNYVVGVTATTTIRRSDWGMTYAVDNGLVGDEIPLRFELEAIRQ